MRVEEAQLRFWMIAAQNGDKIAYQSLLSALDAIFRRFGLRLGVTSRDIDDVVQNALMAVHTSRHTYLHTHAFLPWAFAICRKKIYDHFRTLNKQHKQEISDESILFALFKDDETQTDKHALEKQYETALKMVNGLPDTQRTIVTALKVDGKRVREVAKSLNMTESAVKTTAHRGYKKLQVLVKKMMKKGEFS